MLLKKVFLSYCHEDNAVMDQLQKKLHVHGVTTWRDQRDLSFGSILEDTCRKNVRDSNCDSYLLIVSERSLKSNGVGWELDEAIMQHKKNPSFMLYFYLHEIDSSKAKKHLAEKFPEFDLYRQLFVKYPDTESNLTREDVHDKIAMDIVRNQLRSYQERGAIKDNTLILNYETREGYGGNEAHFEINLCDGYYVEGRVPTPSEWEQEILPAFKRVKSLFAKAGVRTITVQSNAHLSAFLPLGFVFTERSNFHLEIDGDFYRDGKAEKGVCSTAKYADISKDCKPLLESQLSNDSGSVAGVILEVSVTQDVSNNVDEFLSEHELANYARYTLIPANLDTVENTRCIIKDPQHAFQIALQFERYVQQIRRTHKGVPIYLFVAATKGVVLMMGHRIRDFEQIHFHDFDQKKYHPSVALC